jgi:hypothetical protein
MSTLLERSTLIAKLHGDIRPVIGQLARQEANGLADLKNVRGKNPNVEVTESNLIGKIKRCEVPEHHSHPDYEDGKCHPANQKHREGAAADVQENASIKAGNIVNKKPTLTLNEVLNPKSFRDMGFDGGIHLNNTGIAHLNPGVLPHHESYNDTQVLYKSAGSERYGEFAAYTLFTALGTDLCPEVRYAEIMHQNWDGQKLEIGHIMRWADNSGAPGATAKKADEYRSDSIGRAFQDPNVYRQFVAMNVMDYILGNPDRHGGNWVYDKKTKKISSIDNGFALDAGRGFKDYIEPAKDSDVFLLQRLSRSRIGSRSAIKEQYIPRTHNDTLKEVGKMFRENKDTLLKASESIEVENHFRNDATIATVKSRINAVVAFFDKHYA